MERKSCWSFKHLAYPAASPGYSFCVQLVAGNSMQHTHGRWSSMVLKATYVHACCCCGLSMQPQS